LLVTATGHEESKLVLPFPVKVTVFTLEHVTKGINIYLYSFFNLGVRWGGQRNAPDALPPGNTRYPLYNLVGWVSGPV
jgi:hypothetical protein